MSIPNSVPVRPTESIQWAEDTAYNGIHESVNKVTTDSDTRSYGFGHGVVPQQPQRNVMNWWQNSVYKWVQYLKDYIDMRVSKLVEDFSYNPSEISGLVLTISSGQATYGHGLSTFPTTAVPVPDNTTSYIYAYVDSDGASHITASSEYPSAAASYCFLTLYAVTASSGSITDVVDLRSQITVRKATPEEVIAGTDNTKFITSYSLENGIIIPTATTSVYGKATLASNSDIDDQGSISPDDVLSVTALSTTQIRATDAKYGTTCYANSYDISSVGRGVNPTFSLTVGSFAEPNSYATPALAGFVKRAPTLNPVDSVRYVTPNLLATASTYAVPVGAVTEYAASTAPDGWVASDGSVLPDTPDNTALRDFLGTKYGVYGQLPDLRGLFIRGHAGNRSGLPASEASRAFGTFQDDLFKSHQHQYVDRGAPANILGKSGGTAFADVTRTTAASGGTETRPTNITMLYIMKK